MYSSVTENNRKTLIEADRFYEEDLQIAKSPRRTSKSRLFNFTKQEPAKNFKKRPKMVTQSSDSSIFKRNLRSINLKIVEEDREFLNSKTKSPKKTKFLTERIDQKSQKTVDMMDELQTLLEDRNQSENKLLNEINDIKQMVGNLQAGDKTEEKVLEKLQLIESTLIDVKITDFFI